MNKNQIISYVCDIAFDVVKDNGEKERVSVELHVSYCTSGEEGEDEKCRTEIMDIKEVGYGEEK